MNEPIILVENVSVNLRVDGGANLKTELLSLPKKMTSQGRNRRCIRALNKVSCKVKRGERVALIGHNGAGKSTFLRLVSGIIRPSEGKVTIGCNVSPILAKSFITGQLMSGRTAAKAHYLLSDSIQMSLGEYIRDVTDLSGLGDAIDLPVKGYSEGMCSRLLFSMMTTGLHECLALDEGFGTGDRDFYAKAEKRLDEFISCTGTLLLASHSEELVRRFCSRGIVFRDGKVIYDGEVDDAIRFYHDN